MKYTIILLALFLVIGLSSCNTVEGIGQDLEKAGQGIKDAAS